MGILKEKVERIDSLYMSFLLDEENDYHEIMEGYKTLEPEFGPSINLYDYDIGPNSLDKIMRRMDFDDRNFFETFTNGFPRDPYRI